MRIRAYDWKIGFKKIDFCNLLKTKYGMTLSEAKMSLDKVLKKEVVEIKITELNYDGNLELINIGLIFDLID